MVMNLSLVVTSGQYYHGVVVSYKPIIGVSTWLWTNLYNNVCWSTIIDGCFLCFKIDNVWKLSKLKLQSCHPWKVNHRLCVGSSKEGFSPWVSGYGHQSSVCQLHTTSMIHVQSSVVASQIIGYAGTCPHGATPDALHSEPWDSPHYDEELPLCNWPCDDHPNNLPCLPLNIPKWHLDLDCMSNVYRLIMENVKKKDIQNQ